jgi:hypothetical protein
MRRIATLTGGAAIALALTGVATQPASAARPATDVQRPAVAQRIPSCLWIDAYIHSFRHSTGYDVVQDLAPGDSFAPDDYANGRYHGMSDYGIWGWITADSQYTHSC